MPITSNKIESRNPANFELSGGIITSSPEAIKEAVSTVKIAQPVWQALGALGRVQELQKLYGHLCEQRDYYAQLETKELVIVYVREQGSKACAEHLLKSVTCNHMLLRAP